MRYVAQPSRRQRGHDRSVRASLAQEPYLRPIPLIVPFPPGGVADIVGRPFADALSRELKTPVVIENKPGAGGGIGMGFVAKAKPDGYTLLLALSSISILPEADKVTGRTPLFQLDQFVPIARLTADPTVLAVRAESPWKSLAEFVADAKARPGSITHRRATTARCCRWCAQRRLNHHVRSPGAGPVAARCSAARSMHSTDRHGDSAHEAGKSHPRLVGRQAPPRCRRRDAFQSVRAVFFQWSALFAPRTPEPPLARLRDAAPRLPPIQVVNALRPSSPCSTSTPPSSALRDTDAKAHGGGAAGQRLSKLVRLTGVRINSFVPRSEVGTVIPFQY